MDKKPRGLTSKKTPVGMQGRMGGGKAQAKPQPKSLSGKMEGAYGGARKGTTGKPSGPLDRLGDRKNPKTTGQPDRARVMSKTGKGAGRVMPAVNVKTPPQKPNRASQSAAAMKTPLPQRRP